VAKIGDYGLAKAFDAAGLGGQTRTGKAAGTPVFMPRQQVVNFKYAKPEVDVWAAASFYFLVTGSFPADSLGKEAPDGSRMPSPTTRCWLWGTLAACRTRPARCKRAPPLSGPLFLH
jgi:serine/threonine protein kinase